MKNLGKMSIRENGLGKLSGNHQRYEVISRSDLSEQSERWKKKKKNKIPTKKKITFVLRYLSHSYVRMYCTSEYILVYVHIMYI